MVYKTERSICELTNFVELMLRIPVLMHDTYSPFFEKRSLNTRQDQKENRGGARVFDLVTNTVLGIQD